MISSNLVVEGVPGSHHHHHHHHHALAGARSHPIHFSAIHHLNPSAIASSAHLMSAATFAEPSSYLKSTNGPLLPSPEFLRPLPKPAPIVAGRYNGVTNSLNGNIKSRSSKYPETESQGPVNLVHQLKESPPSDAHASYGMYASTRLYQPGPSSYPHYPPPPPSIQSGPYGALYPSSPFTPMLQRDNRSTHLLQLQQYPDSNTPILKSPPSSTSCVTSSVKSIYESSITPAVTPESNGRSEKRPFKVPSGKEGSLKHRILTRPEARVQKKAIRSVGTILPPPTAAAPPPILPVSSVHSNGIAASPTESAAAVVTSSGVCNGNIVNGHSNGKNGSTLNNFSKGSLIQLANGDLKKVEDMQTEDFLSSAEKSSTMRIDPSTVVRIHENSIRKGTATLTLSYDEQRHQVNYETVVEHPYFVFKHGWSSCAPDKTLHKYGLQCRQLQVGDVCVSLSPKLSENVSSSYKSNLQRSTDSAVGKLRQQQQSLQNGHLTNNNVDAKAFVYKKNDLRINSNDTVELHFSNSNNSNTEINNIDKNSGSNNSNNFSINLTNRQDDVKKYDNDSNNNSNTTSDKHDGLPVKKKRRWSAPDQITEEYQSSPLSSPLSSASSVVSSASSVCSAVGSSKNM